MNQDHKEFVIDFIKKNDKNSKGVKNTEIATAMAEKFGLKPRQVESLLTEMCFLFSDLYEPTSNNYRVVE